MNTPATTPEITNIEATAPQAAAPPTAPPDETPAVEPRDPRAVDVLLVDEVEGAIYKLSGICITRSLSLLSADTRDDIITLLVATYEGRGYSVIRCVRQTSSAPENAVLETEVQHG